MKKKVRTQGENAGEQAERGQPISDTGSQLPGSSGEVVSWMSRHLSRCSGIRFMAPEKVTIYKLLEEPGLRSLNPLTQRCMLTPTKSGWGEQIFSRDQE